MRFTRKLYGMIPKPLARTSAAGGRVLELAERLDTVEGPYVGLLSAIMKFWMTALTYG